MFEFSFWVNLLFITFNYIPHNWIPAQKPTVPARAALENDPFFLCHLTGFINNIPSLDRMTLFYSMGSPLAQVIFNSLTQMGYPLARLSLFELVEGLMVFLVPIPINRFNLWLVNRKLLIVSDLWKYGPSTPFLFSIE